MGQTLINKYFLQKGKIILILDPHQGLRQLRILYLSGNTEEVILFEEQFLQFTFSPPLQIAEVKSFYSYFLLNVFSS